MTAAERREALRRELEEAVAAATRRRSLRDWFRWRAYHGGQPWVTDLPRWTTDAANRPLDFVASAADLALGAPGRRPAAFLPWWRLVRETGAAGRSRMRAWRQRYLETLHDAPLWKAGTASDAEAAVDGLNEDDGSPSVPALAFATCSPSGWVRQAALDALGEAPALEALPFIADRLADWVPEVRDAAARALESKLSPLFARALLDAWPALSDARANPRFDEDQHGRIVDDVVDLIRSQARTGLFLESLDHDDPRVRAVAARGALETEGQAVVGRVVERLLADRGTAHGEETLAALTDAVARIEDPDERSALAQEFLDLPNATVRRRATRCLGAAGLLPIDDLQVEVSALHRALLDPSPTVRSAARVGSGVERRALESFYEALATGGVLEAVAGLSDLGVRRHGDLLRANLRASNRFTRRLAVRTLARVEGQASAAELRGLLDDPRTCVLAADALATLEEPVAIDVALALLERADPRMHTAAMRLAAGLMLGDEGLLYLAALAAERPPRSVRSRFESWLRRTNRGGPLFKGASGAALEAAARRLPSADPLVQGLLARVRRA